MMDNSQLIDSLVVDCNNAVKAIVSGQYVVFCALMAGMTQKLTNLKKGVENDLKNRNETIETLKNDLRNAGMVVKEISPDELIERGGAND